MAEVTPAAAGKIARGMPSAWASRQPCTGPEPPNAASASRRGSYPRSIDTTRVASSMLVVTTWWIPQAASATSRPSGPATWSSMPRRAPSTSSGMRPPRKYSGFR